MDKINLNLFGTNASYKKAVDDKKEEKAPVEEKATNETKKEDNSKLVLDSLHFAALQNKAQVKMGLIDPHEYLTADRIKDIEESFEDFESQTEKYADLISQEFPGISDAQRYALAAKAFAANA